MTTNIDTEAFQDAGFWFEDIQSIQRWLDDIEHGRTYTEDAFYSNLEKRLFSQCEVHA